MTDAIVSVVAGRLLSLIEEQVRYHINLVQGAEEEVRKLAGDLETVRNVLDDAENQQFKDKSIKNWLVRLEQTSFEMDDILDEWSYAILKFQMEGDRSDGVVVSPPKQKVWSFIPSSSCLCFKKAALHHGIAKKIIDVKEKLDEVLKDKVRYNFAISIPASDPLPVSWRDPSSSFANLNVVHGRDSDRDTLVTKLMGRQEELGVQIVSIVGVGGLGKTTLAQLAYNDSLVVKSFDLRIWVCVSDPFDLFHIAKGILDSVGRGSPSNTTQLDVLLRDVQESISGKRFLLVLDDVWTEDREKWEPLKISLECGGAGSKVMVTTRNQKVAEIMDTMDNDIHHLGKLTDDECWSLLCSEAFSGKNRDKFEAFKDMSEGIAKKCQGLPLAAKVLGSLLRYKTRLEDWENVLGSEIWQLEIAELKLFPHMLLSYNELSPMHKHCFSYCAIFPKDSIIEVEELIGKWMALGYLGSSTSEMEPKGRECFEVLAMRSLFQDFRKDKHGEIKSCMMHDIVHDFALSLRKSGRVEAAGLNSTICRVCDPSTLSIVNKFCSFSFCSDDVPQNLCNCLKRLRILRVVGFPRGMENLVHLRWLDLNDNELSCEDLKIIFQLYNLQTLFLRSCCLKEIPSEVGCLVQLRHLDLSLNLDIEELPENICSLKELQTLSLIFCSNLLRLPEMMDQLISLKHFQNYGIHAEQLPRGLARLTSLRTLDEISAGGNGSNKLGLLKNLNLLRGTLQLTIRYGDDDDLEDVVKDAREAELRKKIHLQVIGIRFCNGWKIKEDSAPELLFGILDALEPHPNLKRLVIDWYQGTELPAWIKSPRLDHLTTISLSDCHYISRLPPLGKLPCLEDISIVSMYALQFVGLEFFGITTAIGGEGDMDAQSASNTTVAFPKLKVLAIRDCPDWTEWEDITAEEEEESAGVLFMPCLTHLYLEHCPELTELPHRLLRKLSTLEELDLSNSKKLQQRYGDKDSPVWKSIFQNARLLIKWSNRY